MYVLYIIVLVTYTSILAGSGLYNTALCILMYTHVTLINIINQSIIKIGKMCDFYIPKISIYVDHLSKTDK